MYFPSFWDHLTMDSSPFRLNGRRPVRVLSLLCRIGVPWRKSWRIGISWKKTQDGWSMLAMVEFYENFSLIYFYFSFIYKSIVYKSNRDDYIWRIYLILNQFILLWLCKTCPNLESRNFLFDECLAFCEVEIVGPISIPWTVMRPAYSRSAARILHARRSFTHGPRGQKVFWNPERSCQYMIQKTSYIYYSVQISS